jgi:hypothetical protein
LLIIDVKNKNGFTVVFLTDPNLAARFCILFLASSDSKSISISVTSPTLLYTGVSSSKQKTNEKGFNLNFSIFKKVLKFSLCVYHQKWCQFSKKITWRHLKLAIFPGKQTN